MKNKIILGKEKKTEKGELTSTENGFLKEFKRENRELLKTLSKF